MTGPLELKKIAYNIFFELMVLLAIHGRFWSFCFHCLLSALLCGSNMCTQVSSPVSKLEITRLLQPLYVFKSSRAHLRHCVFCSSVSKWGTHLAQTFLRSKCFLSHLLVAGCDIGVRFSIRRSVRPSVRLSTFMWKFDIYVKVSILIKYKTKQPSNLAWNISLTSWLCDIDVRFSVHLSVRLSTFMSKFDIYVKVSILINYKTIKPCMKHLPDLLTLRHRRPLFRSSVRLSICLSVCQQFCYVEVRHLYQS